MIWGATRDLVLHEWQRQIPATFIVDTQWDLWNRAVFLDMPVYSPSEIGRVDPDKTAVVNHYNTSAASTEKIADYISRIGGHPILPPFALHEAAHELAHQAKRSPPTVSEEKLLDHVAGGLPPFLNPPGRLTREERRPSLRETTAFFGSYRAKDYLRAALGTLHEQAKAAWRPQRGHVTLLIGWLYPGGAERQLCTLAVGLRRAGWRVTVLVYDQGATIEAEHYKQMLADEGVALQAIRPPRTDDIVADGLAAFEDVPRSILHALWHLTPHLVPRILHTYKALRRLRPELTIHYMDESNTMGGIASLLAGVPHVFLSARSVAPTHFPHYFSAPAVEGYHELYRLILPFENVTLSPNAPGGARSYARWLGWPVKDLPVIPNALPDPFMKTPSAARIKEKRNELGIKPDEIFILGAFRVAPEKRAQDFIEVVAKLRSRFPKLRAMLCGSYAHDPKLEALIDKHKLRGILTLAGVRTDVADIMYAADLLLHTSRIEGLSNVILEAQAAGLPIVAAENSGTKSLVAKTWQPYLRKVGDIQGLADAGAAVLRMKADKRAALCQEVQKETRANFCLPALTRRVLTTAGLSQKGPRS